MSGRPALNLYGYLISSARTLSVQALFGEHCCWFADSFGEWCSGPKRKHSRRCLLLMKISLHACVHSQSKPSAACAFTQSFSERCPTTLHLWARRLFNCFVRKKVSWSSNEGCQPHRRSWGIPADGSWDIRGAPGHRETRHTLHNTRGHAAPHRNDEFTVSVGHKKQSPDSFQRQAC